MDELLGSPWRPLPAFVIEHPVWGLIVFDTGQSDAVSARGEAALPLPERWLMACRGAEAGTLPVQMRRAGLLPEAVRLVILSHLHCDHVGQLDSFPDAEILAGVGTSRFNERKGSKLRWRELNVEAGTPWGPFDRSLDLFQDGSLIVLPGGGHCPEDLMVMLALEGGPALLTGDAIVHEDWLRSDDVQRIAGNPQLAAAVRNQVRALLEAHPDTTLLFGHDLGQVPRGRPDLVCH